MLILLICLLINCAHTRQIIIKDFGIHSNQDHDELIKIAKGYSINLDRDILIRLGLYSPTGNIQSFSDIIPNFS